jgi:hypothetical protein
VVSGRHVPTDPEPWADALGLEGDERAAFLRSAAATHLSPEVRAAIALRESQPTTTGELDRLSPGLVEATARIVTLERELAALRVRLASIARLAAPTAEDNLAATTAAERAPTQPDDEPASRRARGLHFKVPPRVRSV